MIAKEWMVDAAFEIAARALFTQGKIVGKDVHDILAKHCPLEPDTAYMPVPRCETCAHWTVRITRTYCEHPALRLRASLLLVPPIETAKDFGCVQWESRK